MPRPPRTCPDGVPQHIVNRGNLRATIFRKPEDYFGFLAGLADAVDRTTVRLLAFCVMPNHWHLVLWPVHGCEVSAYMQILMNAHIRDLQRRHGTAGTGHIYQGRYKNSAILSDRHFINVCRYVEANPMCAGLVPRAEEWQWSSLVRSGPAEGIDILSSWPVRRPGAWLEHVNRPQGSRAIREIEAQMKSQEQGARALIAWRTRHPTEVAGTFAVKVPATY
jgi:REP-associated tyrosine transposase